MIHQSFKSNVHRVPPVNKQKVEKTTSGLSRWRQSPQVLEFAKQFTTHIEKRQTHTSEGAARPRAKPSESPKRPASKNQSPAKDEAAKMDTIQ